MHLLPKINFPLLPPQASTFAEKVDPLFYFLTIISAIASVGIFMAIVYMAAKYRYIPGANRPSHALESPALELTWTIIPAIVFLAVFGWAALLFQYYISTPPGAIQIDVVGKQWMWHIQHANGKREVNDLHVPVGRPVELTMMSQDVLHDFYVPAFRVKQDVLPSRPTKLWFEATKVGTYPIFCAEYCGTEHAYMRGQVTVMPQDDYIEWLGSGPEITPADTGQFLFEQQGCISCHNPGSGARGPDLAGLFGSQRALASGETVVADDAYIADSIFHPARQIVQGYTPLMPGYATQLTQEDVDSLIAYIKSLEPQAAQ